MKGCFGGGDSDDECAITAPATDAAREWDGWFYGTQSLKPAIEPVYFGQKPFSEKTGAANVLRWGTGAINVGGCKVAHSEECKPMRAQDTVESIIKQSGRHEATTELKPDGRWPANLIHDGSDEVLACFPETGESSGGTGPASRNWHGDGHTVGANLSGATGGLGDSGSAARFFASFSQDVVQYVPNGKNDIYGDGMGGGGDKSPRGGSSANYFASFPQDAKRIFYTSKADADDRLGSKHPTVKPLDLIQYLVRLVTPKNGLCLDLFAGTGTTGEACFRAGFPAILIEREAEYVKDIERRMSLVMSGPNERANVGMKARGRPRDDGPLFGGSAEQQRFRNVAAGFEGEERRKRESAE